MNEMLNLKLVMFATKFLFHICEKLNGFWDKFRKRGEANQPKQRLSSCNGMNKPSANIQKKKCRTNH